MLNKKNIDLVGFSMLLQLQCSRVTDDKKY